MYNVCTQHEQGVKSDRFCTKEVDRNFCGMLILLSCTRCMYMYCIVFFADSIG